MSRIHSSWVLVGCSSALMRGTDADLAVWLAEHGLPAQRLDGGLAALHVLRQHARTATEALATGRMPTAADLDALNAALGGPPGRLALVGAETPRPQLAFQTDADDAVLTAFRVALSFATFLESGDRQRLKLCANPGCGFAFVDTSINGTCRWCYMRYCGNRLKARAFRRRRLKHGVDSAVARPYPGGAFEGGRVATAQPVPSDGAREMQRRENVFNALALGLVIASAIVFLAAPAFGFFTRGARISLMFSLVTLVLGLTCLLDAWLLKQHKPTFDVTLPPPISGWIGGVAAIAAGWLIGTTIFN